MNIFLHLRDIVSLYTGKFLKRRETCNKTRRKREKLAKMVSFNGLATIRLGAEHEQAQADCSVILSIWGEHWSMKTRLSTANGGPSMIDSRIQPVQSWKLFAPFHPPLVCILNRQPQCYYHHPIQGIGQTVSHLNFAPQEMANAWSFVFRSSLVQLTEQTTNTPCSTSEVAHG